LLGGFVSSTATIATLGAQAKTLGSGTQQQRLAGAASLSGTATWLQALALAALTSPALLPLTLPIALSGALAAGIAGAWQLRRRDSGPTTAPTTKAQRPLRLREALLVAALLLGVSIAVGWLRSRYGAAGLLAGIALAALADAHAPIAAAFGLQAQGVIDAREALTALLVAVGVNSASRAVIACVAGGARYGMRVAAALAASWGAAWLALLALGRLPTLAA
jgi:uncharacterized membrane protein (DUF4010 family)